MSWEKFPDCLDLIIGRSKTKYLWFYLPTTTCNQTLVAWNCASCENNISVASAVIKDMVVLIPSKGINMSKVGKPLSHPFLFYIYLFLVVGNLFGMTFGSERILILAKKLCNSCFIINVKIPPSRLHIFIAFSIAHLF